MIHHTDKKGVISELSGILFKNGFNIARMSNERSKINGAAITVCEIDNKVVESFLSSLKKEIPIIPKSSWFKRSNYQKSVRNLLKKLLRQMPGFIQKVFGMVSFRTLLGSFHEFRSKLMRVVRPLSTLVKKLA